MRLRCTGAITVSRTMTHKLYCSSVFVRNETFTAAFSQHGNVKLAEASIGVQDSRILEVLRSSNTQLQNDTFFKVHLSQEAPNDTLDHFKSPGKAS